MSSGATKGVGRIKFGMGFCAWRGGESEFSDRYKGRGPRESSDKPSRTCTWDCFCVIPRCDGAIHSLAAIRAEIEVSRGQLPFQKRRRRGCNRALTRRQSQAWWSKPVLSGSSEPYRSRLLRSWCRRPGSSLCGREAEDRLRPARRASGRPDIHCSWSSEERRNQLPQRRCYWNR